MPRWIAGNHDKRFILFFNSKCGCTSLKYWFNHTLTTPDPSIEANIHLYGVALKDLPKYLDYCWIFVVREPLRRLVSFYANWVIRDETLHCHADLAKEVPLQGKTFREFIHIMHDLWQKGIPFQNHLRPQTQDIKGLMFDYNIRLEHFNTEMEQLARILGLPIPQEHRNKTLYTRDLNIAACDEKPSTLRNTGIPTYQHFYDKELEDLANMIYAADVEYYARCRFEGDRGRNFPQASNN